MERVIKESVERIDRERERVCVWRNSTESVCVVERERERERGSVFCKEDLSESREV